MSFDELMSAYLDSKDYARLRSPTSRYQYKYWLAILSEVEDEGVRLGSVDIHTVDTPKMQRIYDQLLQRGPVMAQRILSVGRRLYGWAIKYGYAKSNPVKGVEMVSSETRQVMWTKDQVKQYLDAAYSDFKYRNIGLIAHMAYEWGQRVCDMRTLTWDMYNREKGVLDLTQSKRRARVLLPASAGLRDMLEQQYKDFGWQKYVVPNISHPIKDGFAPYGHQSVRIYHKRILDIAKLPKSLRLSDMRRTATTEMIESGVGIAQIMQVTGHANPQSVKPYMKNTLAGATVAMNMRGLGNGDT